MRVRGEDWKPSSSAALWERAVLSSLTIPEEGEEVKLQRLSLRSFDRCHLPYIPLLRSLQTLQLDSSDWTEAGAEVADFFTALISSPLPLLHLHIRHRVLGRRGSQWSSSLLTVLPAFVSAYAARLLTLELDHRFDHDGVVDRQPAAIGQQMTAALLSCRSLRRLLISDWWLSVSVAAPPSPALPHLESLHVDVVKGLDEATLAVLLDAAPHLQELTCEWGPLPYDVVLWVGSRCHELRTLMVTGSKLSVPIVYPRAFTSPRWAVFPPAPALPQLTTLVLWLDALPRDIRVLSFSHLATYLLHSALSLRYLHLSHHDWLQQRLDLLCVLGGLTQLRGMSVEEDMRSANKSWMRQGPWKRYWVQAGQAEGEVGQAEEVVGQAEEVVGQAEEVVGQAEEVAGQAEGEVGQAEGEVGQAEGDARPMVSMVERTMHSEEAAVWGQEALPKPTRPWWPFGEAVDRMDERRGRGGGGGVGAVRGLDVGVQAARRRCEWCPRLLHSHRTPRTHARLRSLSRQRPSSSSPARPRRS